MRTFCTASPSDQTTTAMTTVSVLRSMAVGVTLAHCWLAADGFVTTSHYGPASETSQRLRLIKYVLSHDESFLPVLEQKIKMYRPPYHGDDDGGEDDADPETIASLRLVDRDAAAAVYPLRVLQSVLGSFPWLGSYVEYAAHVLAVAVTCHAYVNVSLLMGLVQSMENAYETEKVPNPRVVKVMDSESFGAAWFALAVIADKVAAVDGHFGRMVDVAYAYDKFKRADVAHERSTTLLLMHDELNKTMDGMCVRPEPEVVYANLGLDASALLRTRGLQTDFKAAFDRVVDRLIAFYHEFGVHTMAMQNWAQVLDFDVPFSRGVKVELYLDREIASDPIGRKIIQELSSNTNTAITKEYASEKQKK